MDYKFETVIDNQVGRILYPLQGIKEHLGTHNEHMESLATRLDYLAGYVDSVKEKLDYLDDISARVRDLTERLAALEDISTGINELVDAQRNQTMALENIVTTLITIAERLLH